MKKAVIGLVLICLVGFFALSCGTSSGGAAEQYAIVGFFASSSYLWIMEDGSVNFSNSSAPVTGTPVIDATVVVSNETTGVFDTWKHDAPVPIFNGRYTPTLGFFSDPGDQISLRITINGDTITGSPTVIPNPEYNLNSANYVGPSPLAIQWDTDQPLPDYYPAAHTWVNIFSGQEAYQTVIPFAQTSLNITSSEVSVLELYDLKVCGVNSMTLSGAKAGSRFYVANDDFADWADVFLTE